MSQFAILRVLGHTRNNKKIVVIAPTCGVCQQKYKMMKEMFDNIYVPNTKPLNIVIHAGESHCNAEKLNDATIIVMTPEKLLHAYRQQRLIKWTDNVQLVIFDDLHLLGNERGRSYEELIAYMKNKGVRLIGLSSTVCNAQDVELLLAGENIGGIIERILVAQD